MESLPLVRAVWGAFVPWGLCSNGTRRSWSRDELCQLFFFHSIFTENIFF